MSATGKRTGNVKYGGKAVFFEREHMTKGRNTVKAVQREKSGKEIP